ncbi:MAG TPA: excalibur calcium-binding domain-containing protein [Allosphingosinicella sp.]|jgi:hypothetical protein
MNNAAIALAAAATFAAVYWVTPAPSLVAEAEPAGIAEAAAPGPGAGTKRASAVAAAVPSAGRPRVKAAIGRTARPRRTAAVAASGARTLGRTARRQAASVYFPGCNEVRAAGLAPLLRGEPGYRPEMDGDDDGIACEPHRGRR